jgi:hypothetical protein
MLPPFCAISINCGRGILPIVTSSQTTYRPSASSVP